MKKSFLSKIGLLTLVGSVIFASCSPIMEEPMQLQNPTEVTSEVLSPNEDINARKKVAVERNYFEHFSNQLIQVDENGIFTQNIPAYFPGTGEGNSTHMGKALTFLNQFAFVSENGLNTVGAPVTQFYASELAEIGLTDIPDEVSSITTDGNGNSVWFKNIENIVTPISEDRSVFIAKVEIIGGTGKFENAAGDGIVEGSFNPNTGEGENTIKGKIVY
ncbi:hypothetical protein AAGF08_07780 [Algoriphagus sp. SE2]|uniref:hypothetical protein n=1 Tax=Algoriphagus sp. SE2 TaxID=3141536 RepID=UPI0031CCE94D